MFYNHCALYSVLSLDNSKFYCKVCDLGFSFKSAYERHVDSARHKMYVASFVPLENEDLQFDEDIPSMLSRHFHQMTWRSVRLSTIDIFYTFCGIVVSIIIGLYPYFIVYLNCITVVKLTHIHAF